MLKVVVKKIEGVSKKGSIYKGACRVKGVGSEEDVMGKALIPFDKCKSAKTSTVRCSEGFGRDGSNTWAWPETDRSRTMRFKVSRRLTCTLQCMTPKGMFKRSTVLASTKFTVFLGSDEKPVSEKKYMRDAHGKKNGKISFMWQLSGGMKLLCSGGPNGSGRSGPRLRLPPIACDFCEAKDVPLEKYQERRRRSLRTQQIKVLRRKVNLEREKQMRRKRRRERLRRMKANMGGAATAAAAAEAPEEVVIPEEMDDHALLRTVPHYMLISRAYEGLRMPHAKRHEVLDVYDSANAERVRQENEALRHLVRHAETRDKDDMNVLLSPEKALPKSLPVYKETCIVLVAHNAARSKFSFRLRADRSIRYEARVEPECLELKSFTDARIAVRVTPRCSGPFELRLVQTEWPGSRAVSSKVPIFCAWHSMNLRAQQAPYLARQEVKVSAEPLCKGAMGVYYVGQVRGSMALCDVVASSQSREVLRFHECMVALESFRCPNIGYYFGAIQTQPLTLVQEAPAYGTLTYIIDQKRPLLPGLCAKILCDCARALEYIHALRRVHGSADSYCFGVVSLDKQSVCGKLYAFTSPVPNRVPGLSPLLPPISAYTSPEILDHLTDFGTLNPDPAWDVYSMGTLIYALVNLVDPIDTAPTTMDDVTRLFSRSIFSTTKPRSITLLLCASTGLADDLAQGRRPTFVEKDKELEGVARRCWNANPAKRPLMSTIAFQLHEIQKDRRG